MAVSPWSEETLPTVSRFSRSHKDVFFDPLRRSKKSNATRTRSVLRSTSKCRYIPKFLRTQYWSYTFLVVIADTREKREESVTRVTLFLIFTASCRECLRRAFFTMASSPEPDRASEFTHFQQTYGPALLMPQRSASFASSASLSTSTATDGVLLQGEPLLHSATTAERRAAKTADDCTKESSVFVWELLLYIPILLQSLFGSLHIVRSLALGWLIQQASTRAPGWLGFQHLEELVRKIDTHAWPPPALLFLAVLTITALVVHPDGFTWVLLRKLR